jgi:glycosyltransferase involved in cell wall biosynthesis
MSPQRNDGQPRFSVRQFFSENSEGLESHARGNQVTSPKSPAKPIALLLDLSGDKKAALEFGARQAPDRSIELIDKAALKWGSKREALARLRALKPTVFVIYTADLRAQSSRSAILLFAAFCGAQIITIGDGNGRSITRAKIATLILEGPRLAIELAFGYLVIAPLSWLLTATLDAALRFRHVARASKIRKPASRENQPLTALFLRATIAGAAVQSGGMTSHIAGFASGARALGHRLKFISSGEIEAGKGVEVKIIAPSTIIGATRALFELSNNLIFTARAFSFLSNDASREFDFIYQRYSRFNWTGAALTMITGLPLMLEFNGSEVWASKNWDPVGQLELLKRFERLNLRAADLICVVSDVQRRELIEWGVEADRVIFNPNGVDTEQFHPDCGGDGVRRRLGITGKTTVGFVGTFGPWHGAPLLAKAALLVGERNLCHFLFIGDGDQRNATEQIIESSAGKVSATFTGRIRRERVAAYLDACDILVSPHAPATDGSEFFGSPTKLFEYMAMARPVIASQLGQIADVITNGENGLLVEPGNVAELAEAIARLAADEKLRARLGTAARQTVIDHYTWRHNAARVFSGFKRL